MAIDKTQIVHRSECLPEIARAEIYEYKDLVYTQYYDIETDEKTIGGVTMCNGIHACSVYKDGSINLDIPTCNAINHRGIMWLIEDLQRLDEFLSVVVENYN